jgi:arabinofuranosyltransferase
MGYSRRWVSEDAFIDFRIVRHLLGGHGPVFNVGERVEAYTSPLWVALLALCEVVADVEFGSVVLGLLLSGCALMLAQSAARTLTSQVAAGGSVGLTARHVVFPLGAVVFAALPAAWDFTTSGLESSLAFAWLAGAFWLLVRCRPLTARNAPPVAVVVGAGVLVRPDLGVFAVGFGVALGVLVKSDARRPVDAVQWLGLVVAATALPVAYQVFRMGYFAALVPSPALAKEAATAYWSQGWRYVRDLVDPYLLWWPLLLVAGWAVAHVRRARRAGDLPGAVLVLVPIGSALVHALYVTRVGGDFMHGRLLLPSLFALVLPLAVVVVPTAWNWRWPIAAGVVVWGIVCAVWLRVPYQGTVGPDWIADERGVWVATTQTPHPVRLYYPHHLAGVRQFERFLARDRTLVFWPPGSGEAESLAPSVPARIRVVLGLLNIGRSAYLAPSDTYVEDRYGLANPIGSRLLLTERSRPGHEKVLPTTWTIGRFADATAARPPGVAEAAQVLRCGPLARLLRAVSEPLSLARFVRNMREAWTFHRLRIPADPLTARTQFCAT